MDFLSPFFSWMYSAFRSLLSRVNSRNISRIVSRTPSQVNGCSDIVLLLSFGFSENQSLPDSTPKRGERGGDATLPKVTSVCFRAVFKRRRYSPRGIVIAPNRAVIGVTI